MEPPPVARLQKVGLRGSAARGRTFERKVLRELERRFGARSLLAHKWFRYEWLGRVRHAQPDGIVLFPEEILLVECKLSHTIAAFDQLKRYSELCASVWPGRRVVKLEACRNLSPGVGPYLVKDPENALSLPGTGPWIWHWLGM